MIRPVEPMREPDPHDELEIGYGEKHVVVRGVNTAILVVVTAFAVFTAYTLWESARQGNDTRTAAMVESHNRASESSHASILKAIESQTQVMKAQRELMEEQNFLLFFANPKEKERLRTAIQLPPRFRGLLQEHVPHVRELDNGRDED